MGGLSDTDRVIATLANAQHGVVARAQLLERGLTTRQIERRVGARRLFRLYYGVYAVGHRRLTVEGSWMAAVLACGPGAVLSHITAAIAWDLRRLASGLIHVTVPTTAGRERRAGIRLHRSATLTTQDVTEIRGVPVTSVARTIIDLSRTLKGRALEQIVDRADQCGLVDFQALRSANSASLQAVLGGYAPAPTRSELEERFLQLCDDHGIPRPEANAVIDGIEVDFVWRDRRLIVEVDGYAYHRSPSAFEADRERDVVLGMKGWRVVRFSWRQITERAAWVAAAVTGETTRGARVSSRPWP
jgi:predicted transcriptional regulator of viral defense system